MIKDRARVMGTFLAVHGIVLILAGPAFHLLPNKVALSGGIVCFVIAAAVRLHAKAKGEKE